MKNIYFSFCFLLLLLQARGQYWQQQVDFSIQVTLNDKDKTLAGFETITYYNNSPDTLHYIWFHVWPNAFKNDRTAFSNGMLEEGNTDFYFSGKEEKGYINRLDFKVDGATARMEDHPQHIDIIKVVLPAPLLPRSKAVITTPFHVKLPLIFSRGGYNGNTFQLTQWYPKPAMYDSEGWHPMPYLNLGEYYNNFGNYEVTITLPQQYVVAATGTLQTKSEKEWLPSRENYSVPKQAAVKKTQTKSKTTAQKQTIEQPLKTIRFTQENVHDFALFADPHFIVKKDTCQLPDGAIVEVFAYYQPKHAAIWKNSVAFTKDALRFYAAEVGPYPYKTVSVVQGPDAVGGGMEYPTITVLSPVQTSKELDIIIAHEVGHNWFQGMLASNERAHPWMDEGFNSFYEKKYTELKYGPQPQWERLLFQTLAHQHKDQPIATHSEDFNATNYVFSSYYKPAAWLQYIQLQLGNDRFQQLMQQYFTEWRMKHPQPKDFKSLLAQYLPNTDSAWQYLHTTGLLPQQSLKGFKILSPLSPSSFDKYLKNPAMHTLLLSPAAGFNKYDGLMVGALITNYKLPPNRFQYLAAPLYGTRSGNWNGLAQMQYSWFDKGIFQRVDAGLMGAHFSKNGNLDSNRQKVFETFSKLTPSIKATFKTPIKSSMEKWIEARTYFISEKDFSHFTMKSTDSLFYVDSLEKNSRYINQLTFNVTDYRALYPYFYQLQLQQGKGFYRLNFTGNYFFNYADGGGANVRWFGAYFGTIGKGKNRFATALYRPKLLGVTGEEDYTYSNYFAGRSASIGNDAGTVENSGLAAQQIMIRDGGLKLRLDQFEFLQGRSEKWVAALNFNTTMPKGLLPFKNPFKLFLDVGTFAEAWKENAEISRFLYVGGLQLSLFQNALNIYAPLVYSKDFKSNLKTVPEQNTFFRRLTFSVDLSQLTLKNLTNNQFSF